MREAAADLEFEEAARLRDELKRLQATELAIADDPFARQSTVEMAVEDAFRSISDESDPSAPAAEKSRASKQGYVKRRTGKRPGAPKTFGSRRR